MPDKSDASVLHGPSKKKQQEELISAYCGPDCTRCGWKKPCNCRGCVSTKGFAFHCQNEPCHIAACATGKGISFCGECGEFPCKLLKDYSCDPEHGDNPAGARIENCRRVRELLAR